MKHSLLPLSLGLFGFAFAAPSVVAQGQGGTFFTPPARTAGTFFNAPAANGFQQTPEAGRFHGRYSRAPRRHRIAYPYYAGYGPYFYSDYDYDDGAPEEAPPAPRPAKAVPAPEARKAADSVVMELRGDHWVRITTTGPVEVTPPPPSPITHGVVLPAFDLAPAAAPLPAAILIFRDGHQEEAAKYTIVGNAIFLKGDYYATGSWTRKVLIADVNIPATLKINSERGTKFALPTRSSEVILRP